MAEFPGIPYAGPARARYGSYRKRYMVIHCTANNASPANEAAFARRRTDGVGMHFVSDPGTVLQVLESWYGTGHVGSAVGNRFGISWEFVGFLTSSTDYYRACINRAADAMRMVMARWGIPHRWLTDSQLRDGSSRGLVTHAQCSRVLGGSSHIDPGPNFPQQHLIDALNGGDMLTPDQEQMLRNLHDWMFDYCRGLIGADPGTPHISTYVPNQILTELRSRPTTTLDDIQIAEIAARVADLLAPQLAALQTTLADHNAEIEALKDTISQAALTASDAPDTVDHD